MRKDNQIMNTPIAKYWLDLTPRGLDHKTTEQLSALPDGRNYIALYTLLYNRHYGENAPWPPETDCYIPYDVINIQKRLGCFSLWIVSQALEVFDELGLIARDRAVIDVNDDAFVTPSLDEIRAFITEKHFITDPEEFYAYYDSRDWYGKKGKIRNWQSALCSYEKNARTREI